MSQREPPTIDHRAHLLRLGLEVAQLAAAVGSVVAIVKGGFNVGAAALVAVTAVLSVALVRTPRPPLPW
jgi:hypothetical protein